MNALNNYEMYKNKHPVLSLSHAFVMPTPVLISKGYDYLKKKLLALGVTSLLPPSPPSKTPILFFLR